jgi:hypothetical protein
MQNTVTRKINPESPVYAPFVFNLGILIVSGLLYLFNASDSPSLQVLSSPITTSNKNR